MARYIDAEALTERLRLQFCKDCNSYNGVRCGGCDIDDTIDFIEDAPTADVVEVTKVVEMLCKIKTNIIKNVSTMIENDFSEIVKDALGERKVE